MRKIAPMKEVVSWRWDPQLDVVEIEVVVDFIKRALDFSRFGRLFSQISFAGFLLPFLRSILGCILDFSWTRICLFQRVSWISHAAADPFSDDFLTIHFTMIFITFGPD